MSNEKMIVNTELELFEYLQIVNDIALEFFNVDGNYQPHIGTLNAMRIFYNSCVKESKYDEQYGHDIFDSTELEKIIKDKEFISAFNNAIKKESVGFDFANAYSQAIDIVESKKASFDGIIDKINKAVLNLFDSFHNMINEDDINKIVNIANKISANEINSATIVDAYAKSQRFHEVVSDKDSDNKKK